MSEALTGSMTTTTMPDGPGRSRRFQLRPSRRTIVIMVLRLAIFAAFLVLWTVSSGRWVDRLFVSTPADVWSKFVQWIGDGTIRFHATYTFRTVGTGLLIGSIAAVTIGYVLGVSKFWADVFEPFITAIFATPRTALIPLFIIWVGFGSRTAVLVCSMVVFLTMFFNMFYGIRSVSPALVNSVRIMGGSWLDVALRVRLPSALVWIVAGLRVTIPQSLVAVVTTEIIAGNRGLGFLVNRNAGQFNAAGTLAAIFTLLLLGLVLDRGLGAITRRALRWQNDGGHAHGH